MRHMREGTLRAFCDGALGTEERARVEAHLRTCSSCAERASAVRKRGERLRALVSQLEPGSETNAASAQVAHGRLAAYGERKKERLMARHPFWRRYRPAWAVAALALLTVITLTVAPIRSLAGDLLRIFRVQQVTFRPVDADAFPDEETLEALAPAIERMFGDALAVVAEREVEELSEAAALERAPFPIRLPDTAEAARHEWTAPVHVAMAIDLARLEGLFRELGYGEIELPEDLDGATVEADFSGMLTSYYGDCTAESTGPGCVTLVQMASPSASVPDGLDVEQLGRIYLELLGTPVDEAVQLSKQIDWTTTLVLPFPHHVNLTSEMVWMDGVEATLVHSKSGYRPTPEYLLTWVKDDIIYAIAGKGDYAKAQKLVGSMR